MVASPARLPSTDTSHGHLVSREPPCPGPWATTAGDDLDGIVTRRLRNGPRRSYYFEWTEGDPLTNVARFLLFGVGEVAPATREVLR
jgi:hypothetical protein